MNAFTAARCMEILVRGLIVTTAHTTESSYRAVLISLLMIRNKLRSRHRAIALFAVACDKPQRQTQALIKNTRRQRLFYTLDHFA